MISDPLAHQELDKLEDFSSYLVYGLITSEDKNFYRHFGIDPRVLKVIISHLPGLHPDQGGASTITQQLARTVFPEVGGQKQTLLRKVKEAGVAIKLTVVHSKDDILKTYLNRVFLGKSNFGFEDAAQDYFRKSAKDLNLAEAATLVVMAPRPNDYVSVFKPKDYSQSPQESTASFESYKNLVNNRNILIDNMLKLQEKLVLSKRIKFTKITPYDAEKAKKSPINPIQEKEKNSLSPSATSLYDYIYTNEIPKILGEDKAKNGRFIVETTLDETNQNKAKDTVKKDISVEGKRLKYSQGALVTLNTHTGEILAFVGNVNKKHAPASTFKLFTYAAAIKSGLSATDRTFPCTSNEWKTTKLRKCKHSRAPLTMEQGLASSENLIALEVAQKVGLKTIIKLANDMGIGKFDKLDESSLNKIDPNVVLGQGPIEASLMEMTRAYATIANKGSLVEPHAIVRVLDRDTCTTYDQPKTCEVIYPTASQDQNGQKNKTKSTLKFGVDPKVANILLDMLKKVVTDKTIPRPTGYATGLAAHDIPDAAGKTGTSDDHNNLWFIGMHSKNSLITGVWLGNDDLSLKSDGTSKQAVQLWANYVKAFTKMIPRK